MDKCIFHLTKFKMWYKVKDRVVTRGAFMENQGISLSPGFIKQLLNYISLITCIITFYKTTDVATFTSSSILFMANNILTCIELPPTKISKKIGEPFVKVETVIIVCLIFGSYFFTPDDLILAVLKWLIGIFMLCGICLVSYIKGQEDTVQDVNAREVAKKIVREANDEYHNDMNERKKHYALKNRDYIAGTSYKKMEGRNKNGSSSFIYNFFYNDMVSCVDS